MTQLALPLLLADHAVFESFYTGRNEALVATLTGIAADDGDRDYGCWAWGPPTSGKSHLLQALCEAAGDRAAYVPMSLFTSGGPDILDGLASRDLICIDDIDSIAGLPDWEAALFGLFNQVIDVGGQLVVSAASTPRESHFDLVDLTSRMSKLPVFQIQSLLETERAAALRLRSRHRGLELPEDTAQYLLRRSRRDMASLYELLDRLDREALRAKRRLTIPFVRSVIDVND